MIEGIFIITNFFLIFISFYISKRLYKKNINPLSFFSIIWLVSLSLCQINISNYYPISLENYLIFYLPIPFFIIGTMLGSLFKLLNPKNQEQKANNVTYNRLFRLTTYFIFFVTCLFAYFSYTTAIRLNLSFHDFRALVFNPEAVNISPIFAKLSPITWLLQGIIYFLLFINIYLFIFARQNHLFKFLAINFITLILMSISMGGRMGILYILYIIISLIIIFDSVKSRIFSLEDIKFYTRKIKKTIWIMLSLLIVVSLIRANDENFAKTIYNTFSKYYLGPYYGFNQMDLTGLSSELDGRISRFGLSFLGFDTIVVSGFFRFLFGLDIPSILSQSSGIMHHGVKIAPEVMMNAHYTSLYSLYIDGGIPYIAVFFTSISFLSYTATMNFKRKLDFNSFILLLILLLFIIQSTRTNLFQEPGITIAILLTISYNFFRKIRIRRAC